MKKIIIIFLIAIAALFYLKKTAGKKEISNEIFLTLDERNFLKTLETEEEIKVFFKLKEDGVINEIENGKEHFIKEVSNLEKRVIDSYIAYLGIKISPFIDLENLNIEKKVENSKIYEEKEKTKEKEVSFEKYEKFE